MQHGVETFAIHGVGCCLSSYCPVCAGMRAGVQDFNVINLGDLEVKFSEGDEVSLETLQVRFLRFLCPMGALENQLSAGPETEPKDHAFCRS